MTCRPLDARGKSPDVEQLARRQAVQVQPGGSRVDHVEQLIVPRETCLAPRVKCKRQPWRGLTEVPNFPAGAGDAGQVTIIAAAVQSPIRDTIVKVGHQLRVARRPGRPVQAEAPVDALHGNLPELAVKMEGVFTDGPGGRRAKPLRAGEVGQGQGRAGFGAQIVEEARGHLQGPGELDRFPNPRQRLRALAEAPTQAPPACLPQQALTESYPAEALGTTGLQRHQRRADQDDEQQRGHGGE